MVMLIQKILCALNIHNYGEWKQHPFYGNKITRQCKWCFKIQDARLF